MASALAGQHALVSGGGRGIGRAIASALRQAGARVSIIGRNDDILQQAVLSGAADAAHAVDVTDEAAVREVMTGLAAGQPFDIVVANAGAAESASFQRSDAQLFRRMVEINLIGTVNCFRPALPAMTQRGTVRLIANASTAGHRGYPYVSAYVAAKHGIAGLTKTVALEAATFGVTANAICPGYVWTPLVEKQIPETMAARGLTKEQVINDVLLHAQPTKQFVTSEEVAALAVYLASDAAKSITGVILPVDGGWTAQ